MSVAAESWLAPPHEVQGSEDGRVTFELPAGRRRLTVWAEGHDEKEMDLDVPEEIPVRTTVELKPRVPVVFDFDVTFTDVAGRPLSGIGVWHEARPDRVATSDVEGKCRLEWWGYLGDQDLQAERRACLDLIPDRVALQAPELSVEAWTFTNRDEARAGEVPHWVVRLVPLARLEMEIVEPDGKPAPEADPVVVCDGYSWDQPTGRREGGRFVFSLRPGQEYTVHARDVTTGYASPSRTIVLDSGEVRRLRTPLAARFEVEVIPRRDGKRIRTGVFEVAVGPDRHADSWGYRFFPIAPDSDGRYRVGLRETGWLRLEGAGGVGISRVAGAGSIDVSLAPE